MRVAPKISLSTEEERTLVRLSRSNTSNVREARRAAIVLAAARGLTNQEIANELGLGRVQAGRWRTRYAAGGQAAIRRDRPRGGPRKIVDEAEIVRLTTQTQSANATHWGSRSLAAHTGYRTASIRRAWHAHGLKRHRIDTFKVSRDSRFVEKLKDVVGLYLDPPEHALVLACDEEPLFLS